MRILITGIGGSGKTTTIEELKKRGEVAVDLDDTELCYWENKQTGEREVYMTGAGGAWIECHSWKIDIRLLQEFLKTFPKNRDIYVGGKIASSQFEEVSKFFDKIFLLKPSDDVLSYRQSTRTNKENNFAKLPEEQKHLRASRSKFEDICVANGAATVDADKPISTVVDQIQGRNQQ